MKVVLLDGYEMFPTRVYRTMNVQNKTIDLCIEFQDDVFDEIVEHLSDETVSKVVIIDEKKEIEHNGFKLAYVYDNIHTNDGCIVRVSLSKPMKTDK